MKTLLLFLVTILVFLLIFIDNDLHHKQINSLKQQEIDSLERVIVTKDSSLIWQQRRNQALRRKAAFFNNYVYEGD